MRSVGPTLAVQLQPPSSVLFNGAVCLGSPPRGTSSKGKQILSTRLRLGIYNYSRKSVASADASSLLSLFTFIVVYDDSPS